MSTTEDILLQVSNVRHKKSDGTLFLMSERIGWLMGSKDTFTVSYKYSDIKSRWDVRRRMCGVARVALTCN